MGWVVPALLKSSQTHPALESGAGEDRPAWVQEHVAMGPEDSIATPWEKPPVPEGFLAVFRHTAGLILSASGKTGSTVNREGDAE